MGPRNNVLDGWFTLAPRGEYDRSVRRQRRGLVPPLLWLLVSPRIRSEDLCSASVFYLFILIFNDCCQTNYLNIYRSDLHKTGRVRRIINCV